MENLQQNNENKCTSLAPGISLVLPHLLLSGANALSAQVLEELSVTFVISAAPELPDTPLPLTTKPLYLKLPVADSAEVNISCYFDEVADMIEEVRQHNGITLVHCLAGVSRSATLCLAYLMKYAGMRLKAAYEHLSAARKQIRPNSGFFQQLREYEQQLYEGGSSVQMIFLESLDKSIPDVLEPQYRAMEAFYQKQKQRKTLKMHNLQLRKATRT